MLQAGLGNQLFIYGAALGMAKRLGADLILDTSLFRFDTRRNYELGFFDSGATAVVGNYLDKKRKRQDTSNIPAKFAQYLTIRKLAKNPKVLTEKSKSFDVRTQSWGDGTKLLGYFQSWRYLEGVKQELKKRILNATNLDANAQSWITDQKHQISKLKDPVLVHLRRGDYLLPAHRDFHGLLDDSYYRRALDVLSNNQELRSVYVISDDVNLARDLFGFLPDVHYLVQPPELSDVATLLVAAGFRRYVIANSSFSWWAAWLSDSNEVVAPKQWFARADLDSRDVCPPAWTLI